MIVLDIETTGIDSKKNSIVSVGAVEFENPQNQFYEECHVWDGAEINPKALDVIGFSKKYVTNQSKQSSKSLLKSFFSWAKECNLNTVAGHNVSFDIEFLKDSARRNNLEYPFPYRHIDTHSLTWMHLAQSGKEIPLEDGYSKIDSDFVFKYVGITESRGDHNALEDAKLTAEAISRLAYGKRLLDEYKKFSIPW
jgi:DNA polymerase III epsilon subunit-like protein